MRGLDLSQPVTAMEEGTALVLDDWVVRKDGLHTRQGWETATEGNADPVTALMSYPGRLFHATAGAIWNGSSVAVSNTAGGDWVSCVLANPGGRHLFAVNGTDLAVRYDGTLWHAAQVVGADSRNWFTACEHNRRIFAAEKNSLKVWFLALNAAAGPAEAIDHTAQFHKGGSIAAIASLPANGGRGLEAQLIVVTTAGEMAVWVGANPERADGIRLVGVFDVPIPSGKRCFARIGGQLMMATDQGVMPVPGLLGQRESARELQSLSLPVDSLISQIGQIVDSPSAQMTILRDGLVQYVLSNTGAWSRFTGFATATAWAEHDGGLYFGTTGGQVRRYAGLLDGTSPIRSFAVDAHSRFGTSATKHFTRVRSHYTAAHPYVPRIQMLTNQFEPPSSFQAANRNNIHWYWRPEGSPVLAEQMSSWLLMPEHWRKDINASVQPWRGISGRGVTGALIKAVWTTSEIVWTGYEAMYQLGAADR